MLYIIYYILYTIYYILYIIYYILYIIYYILYIIYYILYKIIYYIYYILYIIYVIFIIFLFAVKSCKISKFEAFNQATCGLSLLGGRNGPTAVEFEIKADVIESQTGFIHHPQSLLDGLLPNAQRWNGTDIFLLDLAKLFFHHLLPKHEHLPIFKQLQELRLAGRSYELGAESYSFLWSSFFVLCSLMLVRWHVHGTSRPQRFFQWP